MMKVYVVTEEVHYEGGSVVGVYDTREKAEAAADKFYAAMGKGTHHGIDYDITEWELISEI